MSDQIEMRATLPNRWAPCYYCEQPVDLDGSVTEVYLRAGNGGSYGTAPAHTACHEKTCRRCGEGKRNQYGECRVCDAESWEVQRAGQ